jgi:hypothetical protein
VIHQSGLRHGDAERSLPGDDVLPDAALVMDRATTLPAPPEVVWPWLLNLGKDRSGWYLPRAVERLLPPGNRADRGLAPYPGLTVGDQVADWGPGAPTLDVMLVDPPRDLGFRTDRGKTTATWVLHLDPLGPTASRLHSRLRLDRPQTAMSAVIEYGGGALDYLTIVGMFAGLKERLAEAAYIGSR